MAGLSTGKLLGGLKAAAEATRLRILLLLAGNELNVTDLTRILGQSQPRISRHLKLLTEAGLVERFREGSWVYFRLGDALRSHAVVDLLADIIDESDPVVCRDRERAIIVKRERADAAQAYFASHAAEWDRIRSLHVAERDVEEAMRSALGPGPFAQFIDLGTGTGRILELFADRFESGLGIDVNQAMLAYARAKLDGAGLPHCRVRQGDIYNLPLSDHCAGAVVLHQVLHFLDDPRRAIREAARLLEPGGRLLIVDFAPHELDFLREDYAHQRLGFASDQIRAWLAEAGLRLDESVVLAPADHGSEQLTVVLWLATQPAHAGQQPALAPTRDMEMNT